MSLTLHYHPLSSFCWKVLVGLYELGLPFEKHLVDLANPEERAALERLWPLAKFPVLEDRARGKTLPESSIILEYLDSMVTEASPPFRGRGAGGVGLAPAGSRLIPDDAERALECRLRDRLYDTYIHVPMQRLVAERLRPGAESAPLGLERARALMETAYGIADAQLTEGAWALGDTFTLADCSAFPALFYGNKVTPLDGRWPHVAAYLERLTKRPSVARVLDEAAPYFAMFPG